MLIILAASCSDPAPAPAPAPRVLRIAVLPDQDHASLVERFRPLCEYLSERIDLPYEIVQAEDYEDLVELFEAGEVDLVRFGGLTFLEAVRISEAVPLVMRDVDLRFTSTFFLRAASSAPSLKACEGMSFTFGSEYSTSGHLMPRHFMREMEIFPEAFFSDVKYSGAHDRTVEAVTSGAMDVGAANSQIIDDMVESGRLGTDEIRILWVTPPYADYVWGVQKSIQPALRQELMEAFLSLSLQVDSHGAILDSVEAKSYQPASLADFKDLKRIATQIGRLGEQR